MTRRAPVRPTAAAAAPRRARRPVVPAFVLYGEAAARREPLHVEAVRSRSRLYRWEIEPHVHRGLHQLLWLGQGSAVVHLDDRRLEVEAPAALVIPPGSVHGFRFAPESDGVVLTFDAASALEGDAAAGDALRRLFDRAELLALPRAAEGTVRLEALLAALLAEFNAPGVAAGSPVPLWLARAVIHGLAAFAAQRPRARGDTAAPAGGSGRRPALFTRFVVLVEAHHLEHWPITRYAGMLGLSRERLNRLVRAETGRNALALVHERLLREACRRLVYIEAPVASLAYELGFADAAYFTRFFKRHAGLAPSAWRERQRAA